MNRTDPVERWLNSVSYCHSQSKATEQQYKTDWTRFSNYIGKTAEQILEEYKQTDDRSFKLEYSKSIKEWIFQLSKENLSVTSIKTYVGAIKSFFKYSDLPLGMIPQPRCGVIYHNRDITKEEIVQIMSVSKIREKAFFAVMAQSGLRPYTIKQLKIKNLESLDITPCKIEVPEEIAKGKFGSYVTFIGPDATKYLKQYLATRTELSPNSLLFCSHNDPTKEIDAKDMSRAFRLAARKLEKTGALVYEIREGKPSELRLYNLRKYFRKQAHQMGFENVNYLMGHTVRGSDANYKPQDPEFYRDLYREKAMPFLRLETATPTETEKTIVELKKQISDKDQRLQELEQKIVKLEPLLELLSFHNNLDRLLKDLEEGRYAKVESEGSLALQIPNRVMDELSDRAKAKGQDRIEFTLDQLKKMSLEKESKKKQQRKKQTQNTQ